jgi:WD40 repeat protein
MSTPSDDVCSNPQVNSIVFHPTMSYLISGSHDKTIQLFDLSKNNSKSMSYIQETCPVMALAVSDIIIKLG